MIDWIINNKEWLFSGAGIVILGFVYKFFLNKPKNNCNSKESGIGKTSSVGIFKAGETPEGLSDLTGNVWEWTCSDYHTQKELNDFPFDSEFIKFNYEYEISAGERQEKLRKEYISMLNDKKRRFPVLRGGSCGHDADYCQSVYRFRNSPCDRDWISGFRLVLLPRSTV